MDARGYVRRRVPTSIWGCMHMRRQVVPAPEWPPQDDIYLDVHGLAERVFGGTVSEDIIWRWARTGVIPCVRTGRTRGTLFHVGAVKAALRERETRAAQ